MVTGKKGAKKAPRPRSGWVPEDARHTVRVRVPKEPAEILARRWRVSMSEAVIRAVVEAAGESEEVEA